MAPVQFQLVLSPVILSLFLPFLSPATSSLPLPLNKQAAVSIFRPRKKSCIDKRLKGFNGERGGGRLGRGVMKMIRRLNVTQGGDKGVCDERAGR